MPRDGNMYPVMCSSVVGGKEGHASVQKLSYMGIVLLQKMKNPEMQHKQQVSSSGSLEVCSSYLQALMKLSSFQYLNGNWTTKGGADLSQRKAVWFPWGWDGGNAGHVSKLSLLCLLSSQYQEAGSISVQGMTKQV